MNAGKVYIGTKRWKKEVVDGNIYELGGRPYLSLEDRNRKLKTGEKVDVFSVDCQDEATFAVSGFDDKQQAYVLTDQTSGEIIVHLILPGGCRKQAFFREGKLVVKRCVTLAAGSQVLVENGDDSELAYNVLGEVKNGGHDYRAYEVELAPQRQN